MASVSSTSSLGNTSLRGFGGMASGIDRDAIIEKMTLGTTTKINSKKQEVTKLQWKQEAYRSMTDQILDLSDKYASYTSTTNLKDPLAFAKNIISVHGREDATRFVSATGTSDLINNVSITGVKQLATSSVLQSAKHVSSSGITTKIKDLDARSSYTQSLDGARLVFEKFDGKGGWVQAGYFEFPSTYETTGDDGNPKTETISYVPKEGESEEEFGKRLANELNLALADKRIEGADGTPIELSKAIQFNYAGGKMTIKAGAESSKIDGFQMSGTALKGLGYKGDAATINDASQADKFDNLKGKGYREVTNLEALTGAKVTFNFNGTEKEIELITKEEADKLKSDPDAMNTMAKNIQTRLDRAFGTDNVKAEIKNGALSFTTTDKTASVAIKSNDTALLNNLGIAYGESNKVNTGGKLTQQALGLGNDLSIYTKADDPDNPTDELDLKINGVEIKGLTTSSTIDDILSKINSTTAAGVKATYVDATGQFMLVSSETGKGRDIDVSADGGGSALAEALFGVGSKNEKLDFIGLDASNYTNSGNDALDLTINNVNIAGLTKDSSIDDILKAINNSGSDITAVYDKSGQFKLFDKDDKEVAFNDANSSALAKELFNPSEPREGDKRGTFVEGQNAQIEVSYGNGITVDLERASNTFNLEGLSVTVSGVFGGDWIENNDGTKTWKSDSSETVTFTAKADVDGITEKVKSFFEDFNALVTEINSQVTTRPDSSYAPLTDEQKDEMDETSIENWEKKAKQGLLYGDSIMRDMSMDVQSIFTKMMSNGASYEDLKKIGITYSEDWGDGGVLVFDESAFRSAMETDPDLVSNIFTGGGDVKKGLINTVDETFTPYATRYASKNPGNTYGRLIEIAGTEKKPSTLMNNDIYKQLKEMQEQIEKLQDQLKIQEDRYISQFTTMESLINQFNTQSSYLSQITG